MISRLLCLLALFGLAVCAGADDAPPPAPAADAARTVRVAALRHARELRATNPAAADAELRALLARDRHPDVLAELGRARFAAGDHAGALELYRELVKLAPDTPGARHDLGRLLALNRQFADAAVMLRAALEHGGPDGPTCLALGQCYLELREPVAAEGALRWALTLLPGDERAALGLAQALYDQGQYAAVEGVLRDVLRRRPAATSAWALLANARLLDQRPGAALDALEALRRLAPSPEPALLLTLGDLYAQEGLYREAAAAYAQAAARGTPAPERQLALARAALAGGDAAAVLQVARELTAEAKPPAGAFLVLARALFMTNDLPGATTAAERALAADPLVGDALLLLGELAVRAKDYPGAVARYRAARALAGYERAALEGELAALLAANRRPEALAVLDELRRRFPSPYWDELLAALQARQ